MEMFEDDVSLTLYRRRADCSI